MMNILNNKNQYIIILTKVLGNIVTKFFIILIKFLTSIILAKFLGPTGKGITYAFQSVSGSIVNYSSLGIDDSLIFNNNTKKLKNNYLFIASLYFHIFLSIISFKLFFIIKFIFPNLFTDINSYLFEILIFLTLLIGETLTHGCLKSLRKFRIFNILSVISRLNLLIFLFLSLSKTSTPDQAINAFVIIAAINLMISYIVLYKLTKPELINPSKLIFLLRYGIKVHFGTVLSESDYKLDIYFILFFLSAYDLGIYSISLAICSLAIYIPNSITTILFPYTSESKKRNKNFTFFFLSGLTIFQIVFIIFLVLTGESLINFFYGSDFIGSYQILLFLLPGIFFDSLTRILINYYKSNNTMLLPNFFAIFTVIINVSLLFYLLPLYGLIGAAISTSITYALKFLLLLFSLAFLKKITRMFQH